MHKRKKEEPNETHQGNMENLLVRLPPSTPNPDSNTDNYKHF
jgi:hypothetical protein